MFKWLVIFSMKNGEKYEMYIESDKKNSEDLRKEIMPNQINDFDWYVGISVNKKAQIYIKLVDVSSFTISYLYK